MKNESYNPLLKKMGFTSHDKVVIIHVDDVGMCDTTVSSFSQLVDFGIVSSGSVMVPCPGFEAAANWAKNNPHFDLGVHLTLTSEWETFRWGPTFAKDPKYGLVDQEGFFHQTREAFWQESLPEYVYFEMKEQLDIALREGINVSHLDAHMFSGMAPQILPHYMKLGKTYNKTVLLERRGWPGMDPDQLNQKGIASAEKEGLPLFDHIVSNKLKPSSGDLLEAMKHIINELPSGLSYFIVHPAKGTKEMQGIATDWQSRDAEYRALMNPELRTFIQNSGIKVLSFKEINESLN